MPYAVSQPAFVGCHVVETLLVSAVRAHGAVYMLGVSSFPGRLLALWNLRAKGQCEPCAASQDWSRKPPLQPPGACRRLPGCGEQGWRGWDRGPLSADFPRALGSPQWSVLLAHLAPRPTQRVPHERLCKLRIKSGLASKMLQSWRKTTSHCSEQLGSVKPLFTEEEREACLCYSYFKNKDDTVI